MKSYSNFVTDVEDPISGISLQHDELNKHTFAIRAFSLTKHVWIKDFQPMSEMIQMMKRENFFVEGTTSFYYSMLRDMAYLVSYKIVFSDTAKSEAKKSRLTYDLKSIIGRKSEFKKVEE